VLDEAEDYLNSIGAEVLAEVQRERRKRGIDPDTGRPVGRLQRLFRRKR
jgi:hypothetical protein